MKNRAVGLLFLLLLSPLFTLATHLRAGEITVTRINCTALTFDITITVYTNTGSDIRFGDGLLDFGDGSTLTTPTIENTRRPDLGDAIGTVSYTVRHTYSSYGAYKISYIEANRNGGILNIFNSVDTRFYIETQMVLDPLLGCNNSPKLLVPPIDKACTGAAWYHNPGAYDPDGDSISFEMTIPKKDKGQVVGNYRQPDNQEFYAKVGIDYNTANETGDGPPTFTIDDVTGTLTWNAPGMQGEYNVAFLIKEWRKVGGTWVQMGYVTRDMQIIVEDCQNKRPELIVPDDICVEAGTVIDQEILGYDPDSDDVKIEAFSQVFSLDPSRAVMDPSPAVFQPSSPTSHASVLFHWETQCSHVKQQPYQVVFKITDKPAGGQRLIQFKTWNIKVVGPAPTWNDAHTNFSDRTASLKWDPYVCPNATTMQIWRRVDSFPYTQIDCVTGMPDYLGFTQIAEVPIGQTTFTDNNGGKKLAMGAQYCYRLVAVFPSPQGGESYVSDEVCIDPILATAPIVTNVTIDKTANEAGQITVKWRPPLDLDPAQFPPPYTYQVFRAEGLSGDIKLQLVTPTKQPDTVFVDKDDENLSTETVPYNYRILAYDDNKNQVPDTSDVASSVRLEAKPQLKKIELVWAADVPWTNQTNEYPYHLIYRGTQDPNNPLTDGDLALIDSVNVNQAGFTYTDDGHFNNEPLNESTIYCYRIMTRGSYGNPKINTKALINYSQKICAQPNDSIPPCKPDLKVTQTSCEERLQGLSCGFSVSDNVITWTRPTDPACRNDVVSYNIYYTTRIGSDFTSLVENVRDTFYIDANLTSSARCYKIEAVDRSGNKSELSEQFCFDNCPYYELPNVFTPGGLDECNQYFSAFGPPERYTKTENEKGEGPCNKMPIDEDNLNKRCARYVQAVEFRVYNRWGEEVYNYSGNIYDQTDVDKKSIYIDWDGRDNQGADLSAGVYYYVCEVTYDVVDPSQAVQILKGWVHLIR